MRFTELPLAGAYVIDVEPFVDERGEFARTYCREEYLAHGLDPEVSQCSTSWNPRRGTLRGLHFQRPPHQETKVVRATRGAAFGAVVDLRPGSPTYCSWHGVELRADEHRMVYVPKGMAFGFQTLEDETEILYQMSEPYTETHYAGVRWDDPAFGIEWPAGERMISEKDASYPDFRP
jgi:dTDP-4-dehydrorhamnose 3,5-epimerase